MVLMDIHMPVMDGLETTRRIRQDGRLSGLPVIAMTVMASNKAACAAAGMNDHIARAPMPEQLFPVLERWLPLPQQSARRISWVAQGGLLQFSVRHQRA